MYIGLGLIVFYSVFAGPIARASDPCETGLTRHADLSTSFVGLIKIYVERSTLEDAQKVIEAVESSEAPINPFSKLAQPFEVQLSIAVDGILMNGAPSPGENVLNWLWIKNELQVLFNKQFAESQDRSDKNNETSHMFSPKAKELLEVSKEGLYPPEWMTTQDGRLLGAMSCKEPRSLCVYEFRGDKLVQIARAKGITLAEDSRAAWHEDSKGQIFLAVVDSWHRVVAFRLENDKLKKIAESTQLLPIENISEWIEDDAGKKFIVVGGGDGLGAQLLELKAKKLVERPTDLPKLGRAFAVYYRPSWHKTKEGEVYLAVVWSDKSARLPPPTEFWLYID